MKTFLLILFSYLFLVILNFIVLIFAYKFKCHKKVSIEEALQYYEDEFRTSEGDSTLYPITFTIPMFMIFYAFFQVLYSLFKDVKI